MIERPNILLVIVDDHQASCLGAHGNRVIQTPVLDRLAADGCDFQRAYIMGGSDPAVCIPSRAAMLTARNPLTAVGVGPTQICRGHEAVNPDVPLMPEWFRRAGWHTHAVGKWHNGRAGFHRCFASGASLFFGGMCDHDAVPAHKFDATGEYPPEAAKIAKGKFSTELFCNAAVDFLQQRSARGDWTPFFLYLALTSPHDPRTPPPRHAAMYSPEDIPVPENFLPQHPFDNGEMNVRDEMLCPTPRKAADIQRESAAYYGMISHHDEEVGRVIAALELTGVLDRTIVVYMSDHGLALGRHGLLGKQNLYEETIRVPLILRGPGVPRGHKVESLVHSFDLFPTLCELAGLDAPPGLEGISLAPQFGNPPAPTRTEIFAFYANLQFTLSDGSWKIIEYHVNGGLRHQLFDLAHDPHELTDLAAAPEHQALLHSLEHRLAQRKSAIGFTP